MAATVVTIPSGSSSGSGLSQPRLVALLPQSKVAREMAPAACAMTITSVAFNPLDVVKTKLQTQNQLSKDASKRLYNSMGHCARAAVRDDGLIRGLWTPGLTASILRDVINGGVRIGLYPSAVRAVHGVVPWGEAAGGAEPVFATRLLAGLLTGAAGALLGNPTDVVKVRLQAEAGTVRNGVLVTGLRAGEAPSPGALRQLCALAAHPGGPAAGWFRGAGANCLRAALITSAQMGAYDQTKQLLAASRLFGEAPEPARIALASFAAGVSAASLAAPVDMLRSRIMDDARGGGSGGAAYRGALDCACKTVRAEGPLALWKGWAPAYLRLGPHFMVSLPLLELLRTQVFGLNTL